MKCLLVTWLFISLPILSYTTIIHMTLTVLSNMTAELRLHTTPAARIPIKKHLALSGLEHGWLETGCLTRPLMKWIELAPNPPGYCDLIKWWNSDRLTKETVTRNREKTSTSKSQKEDSGDINPATSSSQTLVFFFLWEDKCIKLPSLRYFAIIFLEKYISTYSVHVPVPYMNEVLSLPLESSWSTG